MQFHILFLWYIWLNSVLDNMKENRWENSGLNSVLAVSESGFGGFLETSTSIF